PPAVQTDSTRLVVATTTKDESLPDTPSVSVDTTIPPSIAEQGVVRPPASETPVVASPPPPALGTPTPARRTLGARVGMSLGETLSVQGGDALRRTLDDLVSLGVGWVRVDLAWNSIQPNGPDEYRWTAFDQVVREARARNLQVLALITYTPHWARRSECAGTSKCEPDDPAKFATFARTAVARYAPLGVHTWEVWNEPNLQLFWASGASAFRYTQLLRATYVAIHEADPGAVVLSGGLAAVGTSGGNISAREYLERMYESGAQGYFDALSYHPYTFPLSPSFYKQSSPWSQMAQTEWSVRGVMQANGDGAKKIWITEYGAPTGGPGSVAESNDHGFWSVPDHVSEEWQATILREAFTENNALSWTGPLFWYSYRDLGTNTNTKENFFGVIRADGSHKSAYDALVKVTR
ncbi:MAG: hypothetical protein KBD21_04750, partial [Candidatus Pacebacteria bacterium]|nr:hypothetical protein [Candidatus Paceibacterota bacterium]